MARRRPSARPSTGTESSRRHPHAARSPGDAGVEPAASRHREDRAARLLWVILVVLAALRATFAFVPSMWAWGIHLLRFTHPVAGWALWAAAALALVPALARRVEPWLEAGDNSKRAYAL